MAVTITLEAEAESTSEPLTTPSITIGASVTNMVAFVHASDSSNAGVSSGCTWDLATPESFTEESTSTYRGNDVHNEFFYLDNPTAATDTVTHDNSKSCQEHGITVWSVTGGSTTHRTAPTPETTTTTGTSQSITNSNVSSGDAVFFGFACIDAAGLNPTYTFDGAQSQTAQQNWQYVCSGGGALVADASSEAGSVTISSSCDDAGEMSLAIAAGAAGNPTASVPNGNLTLTAGTPKQTMLQIHKVPAHGT